MGRKKFPPIHPGEILEEEFLTPMKISQSRLARSIHVPQRRVNEICRGRRSVTPDTAIRLSRYFGTSAEFWLNLQSNYDIRLLMNSKQDYTDIPVAPRAA